MSPKGTFMYSYFPNGEANAVLGIDDHPREYGDILVIGPILRRPLLYLIGKISFTSGMGQLNFCVTLLSVW